MPQQQQQGHHLLLWACAAEEVLLYVQIEIYPRGDAARSALCALVGKLIVDGFRMDQICAGYFVSCSPICSHIVLRVVGQLAVGSARPPTRIPCMH